ncbi:helix-turn-helix domain-containing protein [Streptomyces albireticuli]|uniref:Transcriptional regulator n=1 Tax=Streptomyces albireticuli TaxID=1940 RepID=A0A2A2D0T4_9ACTN|nr:helix-turn-helix transcriptional regulator [Streptomyces albireticuli]MCD9141802.1 helix-turn-helix transcriptional regulator [Streptomyces albireticuli]MCD9163254.1 helix-turn-helix transcriptional regulator [Streptomyces albireticuli]MCD9189976.1 helix-turn-helix transcriptional regulator [Streptomyces albireticuli]PAU45067.1 transcriptional regulator [Streptomyces albireticuli]
MPPSTPLPTVRRRRLGTELRRLRERADLSATEAGMRLGITQSRVSNIEAGRYGVSAERVRALARNYDCSNQSLIDALASMTGERRRGWWEEYRETLPAGLIDLAELEHHATSLRVAQVINIPGLLQTADYARAIFHEAVPPLLPHDLEFRVSHRIKRQAILYRDNPPPYTAIIHEAALRMRFGGTATADGQLDHLLSMSERDNITIAVIPFGGRPFPTSGQGVDYLHGPVTQLDTVQIDTEHGGALIDSAAQLQKYRLVLDRMENAALPPAASRDLIHRVARESAR